MGLSERLLALASCRLHVLVVECSGAFAVRAAVEQAVLEKGWRLADSPADADALVVCGTWTTSELGEAVESVWDQLPGPRSRAEVADIAGVARTLEQILLDWRDPVRRRDDAHQRSGFAVPDSEPLSHGGMGHGGMGHGGMGHGGMGHGGMGHGGIGHAGMDHGSMDHGEMLGPGGIALASGTPDRDGLEMDVLHLRLGPVLRDWPAGLVVWCSLQGDAVTEVEVDVLTAPATAGPAASMLAYRVDAAGRVLSLSGAAGLAGQARQIRDRLLSGGTSQQQRECLQNLHRKVSRSRLLRWSLRGLGEVGDDQGSEVGALNWRGDVHQRLLDLIDPGWGTGPGTDAWTPARAEAEVRAAAAVLPQLLPGNDLAAARLVVASLVGQAGQVAVPPGHHDHRAAI